VPHWKASVVAYHLPESKPPKGLTREEALFSNRPATDLPRGAAYEAADVDDIAYPDGALADEVVRRLEVKASSPGQPFFMAVGFVKPHLPFCAPKKYWDLYERNRFEVEKIRTAPAGAPIFAPTNWGELRQYKDMPEKGELTAEQERTLIHGYHAATSFMDAQLGKVVDCLDQTGLAEDTIIVLWGDHGWHLGDHGMWCKHTNYEEAVRIPFMIVAPEVAAGQTCKSFRETVDIYPTVCEMAGVSAPTDLDGKSFNTLLKNPESLFRDHVVHVFPEANGWGELYRLSRNHPTATRQSRTAGKCSTVAISIMTVS
jgi:iduronate 2-sulfatase